VEHRSLQQIREGALPFAITYEDTETGASFTVEGHTEEEAREKLRQKKRYSLN